MNKSTLSFLALPPPPPPPACGSSQSTSTWLSQGLRSVPNNYCCLVRLRLGTEFARIAADAEPAPSLLAPHRW